MANTFNIPGLKEAIEDLEKFNLSVQTNAKSLLDMAMNAEKAVKSVGGDGLKAFSATTKVAKEETDKLEQAKQKLIYSESELAKQIAVINVQIQQQNQVNKASAVAIDLNSDALKREVTSIADARAQNALLTQARNSANLTTAEGQIQLTAFNAKLNANNDFIKANADATLKQKMNIGNYSNGMQNALEKTGLMNGKLGELTRTAIGFVQGGAQAVKSIKDMNTKVVTGAKNIGSYITAKLGFQQAEKAGAVATNASTIATETNVVATAEATVATEAMTVANEGVAVSEGVATVATNGLNIALGVLLSPITIIILALGVLVAIFKDFAPLINPIKDAFAALSAVFSVIKQSIFDLVTGARSLTDIFSNLGSSMDGAAKEAKELAKAQRDLAKAQDINTVANAQAQTKIQELILQSKNRTLSEKERIALIQQAQDLEESAFKKTNDLNNKAIEIQRKKLFEGKSLNEEERKAIESNDFAKIRSLKITKNLNEEELKSYQDLLLKKEDLAKQDQQIIEKAQNRKDQLEDKAIAKAEKDKQDAEKSAEKAQQDAEKKAKEESDRQKKTAEEAIKTMKIVLDNQMSNYNQSEKLDAENIAHVQTVSLMKIAIANAEMQKNLIGVKKGSQDEISIINANAQEIEKITKEKNKNLEKISQDSKDWENELYHLNNKSKIENAKSLTDELLQEQKRLNNESLKIDKDHMREKLKIDADTTDEKLKIYAKSGAILSDNEKAYLKFILNEEVKNAKENEKIDKTSLELKLKTIENETKAEERKYKLLQKGTLANNIFELKSEEKKLKQERELQKDDAKKVAEIDLSIAENKQKLDLLIKKSKEDQLNAGLNMLISVVGQESTIGKAAAIAQATLNTWGAANAILKTASESPETVLFPGYPEMMVGLTVAQGLMTVSKIAGVSMFATGTDSAPYTGKAIIDEIGAEIHTDSNGNVKSWGSDGGAHLTNIVKGDKIIPADLSAMIKQSMALNFKQKDVIDYDKIGLQFGKHASKIVNAVNDNGKNQLNVTVQKGISDRVIFRGKSV